MLLMLCAVPVEVSQRARGDARRRGSSALGVIGAVPPMS